MPKVSNVLSGNIIDGWTEFFGAVAGATSALTGLVFVSLSINLAQIIKLPGLSGRAAETIFLLAGALCVSLVALAPHQTAFSLGLTVLVFALPVWLCPVVIERRALRSSIGEGRALRLLHIFLHQVATLPAVIGGVLLVGSVQGGVLCLAAGCVAAMVVGIINAWVLLVEILR